MLPSTQAAGRRVAPSRGVRLLLTTFCCLTALAVVALLVLSDQTDRTFAWTIQPPVTAAFLGSGYGAGFVLSMLAVRSADWAEIRVPFLTVLVFTWITTVASFVHLDRMHVITPGTGPIAEPAAWFWLGVYVVIPLGMAAALVRQPRSPDGGRTVPLPRWLAAALVVQGIVLLAVGAALFVSPASAEVLWPWPLTPLTARIVAAWLIAFGVATAMSVRDGDLGRLRIATVAYAVFGVLLLTTVVRYQAEVDWSRAAGAAYVAGAVVVVATGVVGWSLSRRSTRAPATG